MEGFLMSQRGIFISQGGGGGSRIVDNASDYESCIKALEDLRARYLNFILRPIGYSVMGRSIPLIGLGHGRSEVIINGAHHGNEFITTLILLRFVEDFISALHEGRTLKGYDIARLADQRRIWVVPLVNPDGAEIVLKGAGSAPPLAERILEANEGSYDFRRWKANARGVDLNDQYDAHWEAELARGPGRPYYRDYGGEYPESEPETRALAEFTRNRGGSLRLVVAYHTQGEEIYWDYRGLAPPESRSIAAEAARISGYRPAAETESDAGYKDWFIMRWRRPGFTVEAGLGENPLPLEQAEEIYRRNLPLILYLCTV